MMKSSNKPFECRVRVGKLGAIEYGFDGRDVINHPWEKLAFDSPLLEVREIKYESGHVAAVQVTILAWNSFMSGTISIGKHVIWEASSLKPGPRNNVGLTRKVAVELFQKSEPMSVHAL